MQLFEHGRVSREAARIQALHLADQFLEVGQRRGLALEALPQLIQFGEVRRPKLGIVPYSVRGLTGQIHLPVSEGVLIYQTAPGGPAEQAGLRGTSSNDAGDLILGDIIVAIDGQKISNTDDLFRILDSHQVGDVVKVEVVREKTHMTVPVKLAPPDTTRRPRQ